MDRIVKQIENGPGELDIIIDVLRQISHHPYFTLNGVKLPVSLNAISRADSDDSDSIDISGVVLLNERNHYRYHGFKARYNVRTRKGSAVFETTCRKCGSEVSEFGLCPKCDPRPQCDCMPHGSCMRVELTCKGEPMPGKTCEKPATCVRTPDNTPFCDECRPYYSGEFRRIS